MANEHKVAYHKWYIVSGPVGGKVTNADGTVTYCTIPEGGEGCFYAVTTKVYTDNAAVQVDEIVNFKGALVASAGSGSGGGACLVTKDANNNYLLGEGALVFGGVRFGTGLGQSSTMTGSLAVAVGYRSKAELHGVSVGAQSYAANEGTVAVGYGAQAFYQGVALGGSAFCTNDGQIALGYKAAATEGHASAVGLEAKAGYGYSTAIGEKTSTQEICSLILAARSPSPGCVLTFELLAKDMVATGENGAIGEANAFITGGALRFGVHDLVSGERETVTISVESLWDMLRAAGGVAEKVAAGEYYN